MIARSARALVVPLLLAAVPVTAQTALMPSASVAAMSPAAARAIAPPTQSADGRLQVTAQRAPTPPRIDGSLDDDVWQRAPIVGGFTQSAVCLAVSPLQGGLSGNDCRLRIG